MSNNCAISIFTHLNTDMGEKVYAQKFSSFLPEASLYDIESSFGPDYHSLVSLNLELSAQGYAPLTSPFHRLNKALDKVVVLSWCSGMAAMCALGIPETVPTIAKIYAHHPTEKIFSTLYQSARVLITESLLASERARAYGLSRVLYIPHHFTHTPPPDRTYLTELAKRLNKPLPSQAIVIGTISRLEYWKNPEFAIEAVRQLQTRYPLILVLKGDFPKASVYPDYERRLADMLATYEKEPWLYWDRSWTPYPDVLSHYAALDFCLQPSGAEGASNLVVELMAMGKPVIVLNATTHPYLFKGGVCFAEAESQLQQAQLSYARPILDSLKEQIIRLCDEKERIYWGTQARAVALERFHPMNTQKKISLMLRALDEEIDFKQIEREDRQQYGI